MKIRDLPGPRGLPVLGNSLQVDPSRLHLVAEEWGRKYGDYFRFRLGRRELLVIKNPEAIAAVLRDRPNATAVCLDASQAMLQLGPDKNSDLKGSLESRHWLKSVDGISLR